MIMDLSKGSWEDRIARLERTVEHLVMANNKHAEAIGAILQFFEELHEAANEKTKESDNGTNN